MLPLPSLLKYWHIILTALVTALVVGLAGWAYHAWSVGRLNASHAAALANQQTALQDECQKDKLITQEISHDYQNQLSDLRQQLAAIKRVQPNRCVPTTPRPASGRDDAKGNPQFSDAHGVFTDDLYDFAFDAEQVGRQLDACQGFISATWEAREQKAGQ